MYVSYLHHCAFHMQKHQRRLCHTYRVEKPAAAPENAGCFNQCGGVMGWCGIEMSFVQGGKCPLWQSGFVFPLRNQELQCIELRLEWKVQGYEHKTDLWWSAIRGHKMEIDTFELQSGIDKVIAQKGTEGLWRADRAATSNYFHCRIKLQLTLWLTEKSWSANAKRMKAVYHNNVLELFVI